MRKSVSVSPPRQIPFIWSAFEDLGDFAEAERWLEMYIAFTPRLAPNFQDEMYHFKGRDDLAIEIYRETMADPVKGVGNEDARIHIFNEDMRAGRYQDRERYHRRLWRGFRAAGHG